MNGFNVRQLTCMCLFVLFAGLMFCLSGCGLMTTSVAKSDGSKCDSSYVSIGQSTTNVDMKGCDSEGKTTNATDNGLTAMIVEDILSGKIVMNPQSATPSPLSYPKSLPPPVQYK